MKKKHLFVVGAIIAIIALFGFGKVDAKADMEVVTDWFSEPHSEYFVYADCVEETNVTGSTEHYVYERYLWHDGKTWRATGVKLVPSDYSFNKLVTSGDYSVAGKNTKKYNIWRSQEYDYAVSEASNGGYNVVDSNGNAFHAWSYYTVTVSAGSTQYRYRYSRTHNEYVTYLNGCYHIRTVPGWTFDVAGWGTESGTNLIIWEFSGQANQTFSFSLQNDGSYIITDQNSGLCMDVDGDTVDGTNICMKTYNGGTSQRWYVGANSDGTYSLVSALFRVFVADVAWGEDNKNGSNVFLWQWHGGQNQRFWLEKVEDNQENNPPQGSGEGNGNGPGSDGGTGSEDDFSGNSSSGMSHGGGGRNLGEGMETETNETLSANYTSIMLKMSSGFELLNKQSERMLNLHYGERKNGTKDGNYFDTFPRDYSNTQRFQLIQSQNGFQLRNYCHATKLVGVDTKGRDYPVAGDAVCIYSSSSNESSCWKINYRGKDNGGVYINIENVKTPGLYIGHPDNDTDGKDRKGLVLCNDGDAEKCLWYIYVPKKIGIEGIYDREAAATFAKEKANGDKVGLCAEFVARSLASGGLYNFGQKDGEIGYAYNDKCSNNLKNVGGLRTELLNSEIVKEGKKCTGEGTLNKKNCPGVEKGDVIIWKNAQGSDNWWGHTAIVYGFDDDGNVLVCAHNKPKEAEKTNVIIWCGAFGQKKANNLKDKGIEVKKNNDGTWSRRGRAYIFHINV